MKPATEREVDEHNHAVITGGAKGFLGGLGVALPASYLAHLRWPYYRSLQPSLKLFGIILVAVPSFVISAERAGLAYERARWDDVGKAEMDVVERRRMEQWTKMSAGERVRDFARNHQYSLITGSWVASMLGSYALVAARDPTATQLQKITQTRVWAQGITLGIIISAAILTHARTRGEKAYVDHSWRDVLEREVEEEKAKERTKKA